MNAARDERVRDFWDAFVRAAHISGQNMKIRAFGDSSELADELAALVVAGVKRAATSLKRDFLAANQALPQPGDLCIVVDGSKIPRCIVRTMQVDVKPIRAVDERFAWEDGEGDRSLVWWIAAHTRYFRRRGSREGFDVDEGTEVVLERFDVVWPPELADQ